MGRIDQVGSRWFITTLFSRDRPSESGEALVQDKAPAPDLGTCLLDACRCDQSTCITYTAYLRHHEKWLQKVVKARGTGGEVEQGLLAAIREELQVVMSMSKKDTS